MMLEDIVFKGAIDGSCLAEDYQQYGDDHRDDDWSQPVFLVGWEFHRVMTWTEHSPPKTVSFIIPPSLLKGYPYSNRPIMPKI
jgi:hypothetical protein